MLLFAPLACSSVMRALSLQQEHLQSAVAEHLQPRCNERWHSAIWQLDKLGGASSPPMYVCVCIYNIKTKSIRLTKPICI